MNETTLGVEPTGTTEYLIILPVIVISGLIGNAISLLTIFNSRLRYIPANQYLICLTTSDTAFLLGLMILIFKLDMASYMVCVLMEYTLMTSSYISSWTVAALTIERYIALSRPLQHVQYAHKSRVRIMLYWVPIPFILHLYQFVALVPPEPGDPIQRACTIKRDKFNYYVDMADMLLCFIIPCAIVVILNLLVACTMKKAKKQFRDSQTLRDSRRQGGSQAAGAMKILWMVPMAFVILNTPFYLFRMFDFLGSFEEEEEGAQPIEQQPTWKMLIHNGTHYMYYMNFSCNVIVYAFSSRNFRKIVWNTMRKLWDLCCPRCQRRDLIKTTRAEPMTTLLTKGNSEKLSIRLREDVTSSNETDDDGYNTPVEV